MAEIDWLIAASFRRTGLQFPRIPSFLPCGLKFSGLRAGYELLAIGLLWFMAGRLHSILSHHQWSCHFPLPSDKLEQLPKWTAIWCQKPWQSKATAFYYTSKKYWTENWNEPGRNGKWEEWTGPCITTAALALGQFTLAVLFHRLFVVITTTHMRILKIVISWEYWFLVFVLFYFEGRGA
jgi:hypothetical protein